MLKCQIIVLLLFKRSVGHTFIRYSYFTAGEKNFSVKVTIVCYLQTSSSHLFNRYNYFTVLKKKFFKDLGFRTLLLKDFFYNFNITRMELTFYFNLNNFISSS